MAAKKFNWNEPTLDLFQPSIFNHNKKELKKTTQNCQFMIATY